jgi:hypothetical protein
MENKAILSISLFVCLSFYLTASLWPSSIAHSLLCPSQSVTLSLSLSLFLSLSHAYTHTLTHTNIHTYKDVRVFDENR